MLWGLDVFSLTVYKETGADAKFDADRTAALVDWILDNTGADVCFDYNHSCLFESFFPARSFLEGA